MGISIIICSVKPNALRSCCDHIEKTIGIKHEVIGIDNRGNKYSIAAAYNLGAKQARYQNLVFMHEDVSLNRLNWGKRLVDHLDTLPNCGAVGFAGSKVYTGSPFSWYAVDPSLCVIRANTFGRLCNQTKAEEVVVLDGLFMACRKEVWQERPFDEQTIDGFHAYDLDFCLSLRPKFKNYVLPAESVIHHSLGGTLNRDWFLTLLRVNKKHAHALPLRTERLDQKLLHQLKQGQLKVFLLFHLHLTKNFTELAPYLFKYLFLKPPIKDLWRLFLHLRLYYLDRKSYNFHIRGTGRNTPEFK
jgi:hypothetical protein